MRQMQAHEVIDKVWPRSQCCGATNQPCTERCPVMRGDGCQTCGHSLGCHIRP